ncbi:hypothetical protein BO70DRAFT_431639 [Aspergillus heteromorphus CBS 117.55]|uniref:Uncharacterized protein n=1 Tax=Aspergillus heteromorphus CBS 117.55 TaxID=1448321 RepID=A0A317VIK0_9EURO|nr:uncharacterized protein BO70DRAFT_431639 [Aspergillus heteromorphus CBS 117.55]PWY73061.1 hypothetical protein BO70DRAFT_431639 [Aspergillus heteromorphus CBS 117.55]
MRGVTTARALGGVILPHPSPSLEVSIGRGRRAILSFAWQRTRFQGLEATINHAAGLGAALENHAKRGSEQNATLYAYGANASAWFIAYGLSDGLLYVAENPDDTDANLAPMSWDLPSITDECWIVNRTFVNSTAPKAGSLYIRLDDGNAIGVLPYARATTINGVVTGFALFATQLVVT